MSTTVLEPKAKAKAKSRPDFERGLWMKEINVRHFIQQNYTPYHGDESFLAGPTKRTTALWKKLTDLFVEERKKGVLDISQIPSTITAHDAGYIDKGNEVIVGLQTEAPLKRAIMDLAPSVSVIQTVDGRILVPRAEAVKLLGISAYLDFNWSKNFTSAIGYSFDKVDNTNFQDPTAFHRGDYASVNLLWTPIENVMTGAELLWGKRTDNDGETGHDLRLQYTFKWSFSSKNIWDYLE